MFPLTGQLTGEPVNLANCLVNHQSSQCPKYPTLAATRWCTYSNAWQSIRPSRLTSPVGEHFTCIYIASSSVGQCVVQLLKFRRKRSRNCDGKQGKAKATFHETGSELAFPVKHRASSVSGGDGWMRLRGDDGGRRGTCKNSDDRGNPRWTSATEIGKGLPLKADKSRRGIQNGRG